MFVAGGTAVVVSHGEKRVFLTTTLVLRQRVLTCAHWLHISLGITHGEANFRVPLQLSLSSAPVTESSSHLQAAIDTAPSPFENFPRPRIWSTVGELYWDVNNGIDVSSFYLIASSGYLVERQVVVWNPVPPFPPFAYRHLPFQFLPVVGRHRELSLEQMVWKVGAASSVTRGVVRGYTFQLDGPRLTHGPLAIVESLEDYGQPFAKEGDSGAPVFVFSESGWTILMVGIVHGGRAMPPHLTCVALGYDWI